MQVYIIKLDGKNAKNHLGTLKEAGNGVGRIYQRRGPAQKLVDAHNERCPPLPNMDPSAVLVTYELVEVK